MSTRSMLAAAAVLLLAQPALAAQPASGGSSQSGQSSAEKGTFRQEGQASYFRGGEGDNTETKSGEPVDPEGMTAAHRTLPLGTVATVTNQDTGKSVEVRINDRGPERQDRVIDLSEAAARQLGMEETGVAPVTVEADPGRQRSAEVREQLQRMARD